MGLPQELREALDDPKRGEWGGYPWEHLGDAERDVRQLLRLLEQRTQERDEARADELDENLIAQDYHASFLAERERVRGLEAALRRVEPKQQEALAVCRKHGFVFDDIGTEPGNWQHLAFTFYSYLCEINAIASQALQEDAA